MRRQTALASLALVPAVALAPAALRAQAVSKDAPIAQPAANAAPALPSGWSMRLDRPGASTAALRFTTMGGGYHVTTGPSGIFYSPQTTAAGAFDAEATFTQTKAPAHPEAYGLIVGGRDLDGASPDYLYFVVRGDGKYMIRHRAGAELHTLQDWTAHQAVVAADAAGKATNALRVRAAADSVRFDVNGTQVAAFARVPMLNTDGVVGLRVNHQLDVHVDGPRVTRR